MYRKILGTPNNGSENRQKEARSRMAKVNHNDRTREIALGGLVGLRRRLSYSCMVHTNHNNMEHLWQLLVVREGSLGPA